MVLRQVLFCCSVCPASFLRCCCPLSLPPRNSGLQLLLGLEFSWVLGMQTQVVRLAQQMLHPLSRLPRPVHVSFIALENSTEKTQYLQLFLLQIFSPKVLKVSESKM